MRRFYYTCLVLILLAGCNKETNSKVEIYMLTSFTTNVDQTTSPPTLSISNAVLADTPLVADNDIALYVKSTTTFLLKRDIKSIIQNYGADRAFAVTINKQPIYYGKFHPAYMSSITLGLATIDPILMNEKELKMYFATLDNDVQARLDKRNDTRLLQALKASGRLR